MAAMWSARVPRLPLSVECTVQLLQAQHEGSVSGYSLAVVRYDNSTNWKNKVLINVLGSNVSRSGGTSCCESCQQYTFYNIYIDST